MILSAARLAVQLALGCLFLVSSAGKVRHPLDFLRGVAEYQILPRPVAYVFGAALIPAEAFLAVGFLSGFAVRAALPIAAALLVMFAAAIAINLRRHRDMRCHCYGSLGGDRVSVRSLAQLGLLLGGLLFVWTGGGVAVSRLAGPEDVLVAAAWAAVILTAGLWALHADQVVQLFRPGCKTCTRRTDGVVELAR